MRKIFFTFVVLLALIQVLPAQNQKGLVVIQNSGKKPLPQVSIVISDAQPTTSDADGAFSAALPNHVKGQRLMVQDISYKDWVVVNSHMVEQWVYAPDKVYRVDMCPKQDYDERAALLYDIGRKNARDQYNVAVAKLKALRAEGEISASEYLERQKKGQEAVNKAQSVLDEYIPLILAINSDYLLPIEKQAQELVMSGRLDEAIALYEGMNLEGRLRESTELKKAWDDEIEDMIPSIERFAHTLMLQGGEESYSRAGELLKMIADSSPKHKARNNDYANFALLQGLDDDAKKYYKHLVEISESPYDLAEWYEKLGIVHLKTNEIQEAVRYYNLALETIEELDPNIAATGELMSNLEINYTTVLVKAVDDEVDEDKRHEAYTLALKMLENAENILLVGREAVRPRWREALILCYGNMAAIYRTLHEDKMVELVQFKIEKLQEEMGDLEDADLLRVLLTRAMANSGSSRNQKAIEDLENALVVATRLYKLNPMQHRWDLIQVHSQLGYSYYYQSRYDDAIVELVKGLELFNTCSELEKASNNAVYVDFHYQLVTNYVSAGLYEDAFATFMKILPQVEGNDLEYDLPVWVNGLVSAFYLGKYEILAYEDRISELFARGENNQYMASFVDGGYLILASLHNFVGNYEEFEYYFDMSDKCAKKHGRNRMLAYNKLNDMFYQLLSGNYDDVLKKSIGLEKELYRVQGDEDSFAQLNRFRLMAYVAKKDWKNAEIASAAIDNGPHQYETSVMCQAHIAQIYFCLETGRDASVYVERLEAALDRLKIQSRFSYIEQRCDYNMMCLNHYMNVGDNDMVQKYVDLNMDSFAELERENSFRSFFMSSYFFDMVSRWSDRINDAELKAVAERKAVELFSTFDDAFGIEKCSRMYNWVSAVCFGSDMMRFENEVRLR